MKKIFSIIKAVLKFFKLNFCVRWINDFYHMYWYRKLKPYFISAEKNNKSFSVSNSRKIWVFWWQGLDDMPLIVSKCYKSILNHSNGFEVVLVTKDNFNDYTDIDYNILEKFRRGYIDITFFSDVLRFNLLKNNGGIWIDATVMPVSDIEKDYFSDIFTVGINDTRYHDSINGGFSSFIFGGTNTDLIGFMNTFYEIYYKNNDRINYYFTLDLALQYCYKNNIGGFKDYVDDVSFDSDPDINSLSIILNDRFDYTIYKKFRTRFFKLTYKKEFMDDEDTFYLRIVNDKEPFRL